MAGKSARKLSPQNLQKDADLDQNDSNRGENWSDSESIWKTELTGFSNILDVKDDAKVFWPSQPEGLCLYELVIPFQLKSRRVSLVLDILSFTYQSINHLTY